MSDHPPHSGFADLRANRRGVDRWAPVLVAVLLSCFAVQAISSMRQKSVTIDEMMYVAAGYYHLKTGDFTFNMTNTPLMKVISAVPLLALNPDLPPMEKAPRELSITDQWRYARAFMYDNRVDADKLLFAARLPTVALAIVLGLYLYIWGSRMFGSPAGVLALALFSFSPNILAHARLATHDVGLAAFMFIACYYFWRYLSAPSARHLLLCGVATGSAILVKTTAIFLAPVFIVFGLYCIAGRGGLGTWERLPFVSRVPADNPRARQAVSGVWALIAIGAVALVTLNAGYLFQGSGTSIASYPGHEGSADDSGLKQFVRSVPLPVPMPFTQVFLEQRALTATNANVYFAGELHRHGKWYLTAVAVLLKTPLALFVLLIAALAFAFRASPLLHAEWLALAAIGVVLFVFSFVVAQAPSVRYVLPMYPFMHLLVGRLAVPAVMNRRIARFGIPALLLWYLGASGSIHQHYLAYFNESIGGPSNGYRYLANSNLDWGQDLKTLKRYLDDRGVDRVNLGYFGSADASYYGIAYTYLPSVGLDPGESGGQWWYELDEPPRPVIPEPGVYAISATLLASPGWMADVFRDTYAWFREREPDDQVGYSILIYNVD